MANTSTEDLSNKNITRPLIRTMEDDLRLLKANPSLRTPGVAINPTVVVPAAKPAAASVSAGSPLAVAGKPAIKSDDAPKKAPISFAPSIQDDQASIKVQQDIKIKENDRLIQIEAEKALDKIRKKNEELRKEKEKAEQLKKEKERLEMIAREKEALEKARIQKEKERLAQIEAEKELEKIRKRDAELKAEREKAEQAKRDIEETERLRKEKMKAERDRVKKEKERLAQIEVEKELEKQRKRDEELRTEKEKADRIKKEKEIIEQAKREEAMKIRKKLSDEIKKEMEADIAKEREKAEQVKIQMELEIKKEIELAEQTKKEREAAMRKRVAKVVKEEMDQEIEKEREKAEQIKREVEAEIKKEMEENLKKEKELEEKVMEEMTKDMRKEIAEQIKRDKDIIGDKSKDSQPKKEEETAIEVRVEDVQGLSKTNPPLKVFEPAVKIADAPVNLPINHIHSLNDSGDGKIQTDDEDKKTVQSFKKEEELEALRKKNEELRKEKEMAEQLKKEKERLEMIAREKEALEKARIQKEKERFVRNEAKKETGTAKDDAAAPEADLKNKNIFAYKNAWKDSPLNSEFFADTPKTAATPVSTPASSSGTASAPASNSTPDSMIAPGLVAPPPANLPKEPKLSDLHRIRTGSEDEGMPTIPDFQPAEPSLEKKDKPLSSNPGQTAPVSEMSVKPPVDLSPKKKLSSFSAESNFGLKTENKTVKKQYLELSGEYEHLSPEMRLAQQGFSSLSADLEEGVRKDAELLDQDLALKKKVATSNSVSRVVTTPGQTKDFQVPVAGSLRREPTPVFKTIIKIAFSVLFVAGIIYGIYNLVFKTAPANNVVFTEQPILTNLNQLEIPLDFKSNAMSSIKDFIANNAESADIVSRAKIKDITDGRPLKITDFEKVLGLIIPAQFLENLAEDYDLIVFNYPKNNYLRMGMILKVKDADLAISSAKQWEQTMFIGTNSFLFDASGYYDNTKSFSDGNYKNIPIRYLSLGKNNLALNYAVYKNKSLFLFATSQDDIHYLIDELEK